MTHKFPSRGWIESYKDTLNGEKGKPWQEAAKTWEGDFLFVIEPDEKLKKGHTFYIDLWHGECRKVDSFEEGEKVPESEFEYKGTYSNWLKVINGELDPIKGILMRKFALKGSKAKVMRATKAAKELVNTAQKVETEFL